MNDKIWIPPAYLNRRDILNYEIRSSWWAHRVKWEWIQELTAMYFNWKVNRKYSRYLYWMTPK